MHLLNKYGTLSRKTSTSYCGNWCVKADTWTVVMLNESRVEILVWMGKKKRGTSTIRFGTSSSIRWLARTPDKLFQLVSSILVKRDRLSMSTFCGSASRNVKYPCYQQGKRTTIDKTGAAHSASIDHLTRYNESNF
jgi:hypothetical protein